MGNVEKSEEKKWRKKGDWEREREINYNPNITTLCTYGKKDPKESQ